MQRLEALKEEIFEKVREYYALAHAPGTGAPFVPGESRVTYGGRVFDEKEMVNLVDSALDFWLTYGPYSKRFEEALARYLGVRFVLSVNSGSSANLLAFFALTSPLLGERRIQRGDEVITVAAAFPTTVAPIVQYGAVPVFVDMEPVTCNIDPQRLEEALSAKTKAVMVAHTLGNPFDIEKIKAFCDRHGLWLIEDNCDALGSRYDGKLTGTWGDIGTGSFYPPHHLTTGEGGAVYTDDPLLKKILLSMRDWGRDCWCESGVDNTCGRRFSQRFGSLPEGFDHKYVYSHFGFNLKMTEMQAAVGLAQIDKLPDFVRSRRQNWQRLYEGLKDLNAFEFVQPQRKSEVSWFGFLLTLRGGLAFERNDLVRYLEAANIQTRNLFAGNLLRHPLFAPLREGKDYRVAHPLVHTERIMRESFWVGVYPGLSSAALDYMVEKITGYVRACGEA